MNYLQWLTQKTPTLFWHDSAIPDEIDAAIKNGATTVTTNPVLTYKTLQAVPEFWQPMVDQIPKDLTPAEHAEALLKMVATYAAGKVHHIYEQTNGQNGYALGQLDPTICMDSEKMLAQALRYSQWTDNICIKMPMIKSALPVVEELASRGIAVCTTLIFSVSQAVAAGEAYMRGRAKAIANGIQPKPIIVVQQGGRLDEYLLEVATDNRIDIDPQLIQNAGNAVCKKVYGLFKERDIPAIVSPAGLRGVNHLTAIAGADMAVSMQTRVQKMVLDADPEQVCHIGEEVPAEIVQELYKIPEFVRAYEEGAMKPEEFITFGLTQKTLAQFLWTGWVPLETYQKAPTGARWF